MNAAQAAPLAAPKFYTCSHCASPIHPSSLEILQACPTCGEPWTDPDSPKAPPPLDLPALRARAGGAVQEGNDAVLLAIVRDELPQVLSLVGEMARALAALAGDCRCKGALAAKGRIATREPCPHARAAAAFRRAGIAPEDVQKARLSMPLVIR